MCGEELTPSVVRKGASDVRPVVSETAGLRNELRGCPGASGLGCISKPVRFPRALRASAVHGQRERSVLGTAGINLVNAGTYKITFSVSGVEPSQMALFDNGAPVPGTVYGSGAGTQQNIGQAIITVAAGDVLTIRNHSSAAAVTLQTLAGGTQTNVNASITIEKLA
jgi:hypothetical protein